MEFNRLISLVIGFIVLILVFVWIGSRFRSTTKTESSNTVTLTVTPTITPTKEEGTGWNPFAFLFNRDKTPTPTPSKVVATKVSITPTTIIQKETGVTNSLNQGVQQIQEDSSSVIVYKNNRAGKVTPTKETVTKGGLTQIPETGAPTMLIPIAFSALTLGAYLKKRV